MSDDSEPLPEAIPAATLVIFRDRADGSPELLMVERAKAMAFAGGALVFPGGRIDPGDRLLAALPPHDRFDDAAARLAAVRETVEEAGLAVALEPPPSPAALARLRAALHAGEPLADALAAAGTAPALDQLVSFARWRPAHRGMRLFDTWFYLARAPHDAEATVDRTENVRLSWMPAADVLAEADAGRVTIIFPTRRNLERLALFNSFDEAVAHARAHPVRVVTPWTEDRDGVAHLCIPDDLGYPVTSQPTDAAFRG